jgi:hypothetical protein
VEFKSGYDIVKLQVKGEESVLNYCETVKLSSDWRPHSELLIALVM